MHIALAVAILGFFGIETTSFAALLAGAGIAVGAAGPGLLANFAAAVFLVILRPFKAGDFISAAGQVGTVKEIGNNKILSDTIQNFSANPCRRVELVAQLAGSVDANAAIQLLQTRLQAIPNVARDPLPDVEILQFTMLRPLLAVRPYCHTDHYWQVFFDTNKLIHSETRVTSSQGLSSSPQPHCAKREEQ